MLLIAPSSRYAHRVDDYIPIFKENLRVSINQKKGHSKIAPAHARADEAEVLLDIPPLDEDVAVANDPTVNYRRMTKDALIAEARSERRHATHFPTNPWCPICCEANLMQRKFARSGGREDDQLPPVLGIHQMWSTGHIIVARSNGDLKESSDGEICSHTIRDCYSGAFQAIPDKDKDETVIKSNYVHFYSKTLTPTKVIVIVKSDNYKSLLNAASLLGWKSETTLANR